MLKVKFILIAACLALAGCSSVKYMPMESIRADTTYISNTIRDSVYLRDSIYIEHKNDTVYLNKYKYLYKYIERYDTLLSYKTDTLITYITQESEGNKTSSLIKVFGVGLVIGALLWLWLVHGKQG